MLAKDLMTTGVISVLQDTPVAEIARTLLDYRISAVPVLDAAGRMVGIVSEGDLVRRAEAGEEQGGSWWLSNFPDSEERAARFAKTHGLLAKDVMTTSVITADENDAIGDLAALLEENRIKRVPVVRKERVVGIVSRANLLHGLAARPGPPAAPKPERSAAATPKSPASNDSTIRATILNRLRNEIGVDRVINVIVSDGVVDLWGGVRTEAERQAVRAVAENAPNVAVIKDHLGVLPDALRHSLRADNSN